MSRGRGRGGGGIGARMREIQQEEDDSKKKPDLRVREAAETYPNSFLETLQNRVFPIDPKPFEVQYAKTRKYLDERIQKSGYFLQFTKDPQKQHEALLNEKCFDLSFVREFIDESVESGSPNDSKLPSSSNSPESSKLKRKMERTKSPASKRKKEREGRLKVISSVATLCLKYEFGVQILNDTKRVEIRRFTIPLHKWILIYCSRQSTKTFQTFCAKFGHCRRFESERHLLTWLRLNENARPGAGLMDFSGYFQKNQKPFLSFIEAIARIDEPTIEIPRGQGIRYFTLENGEKYEPQFDVLDCSRIDLRWLKLDEEHAVNDSISALPKDHLDSDSDAGIGIDEHELDDIEDDDDDEDNEYGFIKRQSDEDGDYDEDAVGEDGPSID